MKDLNLKRTATLNPKYISLRIDDNKISIEYHVIDDITKFFVERTFLNFEPSKALMDAFKTEIEQAFKAKGNKETY